jgi:hypothetical protein
MAGEADEIWLQGNSTPCAWFVGVAVALRCQLWDWDRMNAPWVLLSEIVWAAAKLLTSRISVVIIHERLDRVFG